MKNRIIRSFMVAGLFIAAFLTGCSNGKSDRIVEVTIFNHDGDFDKFFTELNELGHFRCR